MKHLIHKLPLHPIITALVVLLLLPSIGFTQRSVQLRVPYMYVNNFLSADSIHARALDIAVLTATTITADSINVGNGVLVAGSVDDEVSIDGGLTVGSTTAAGDNNLRVEGTITGASTASIESNVTINPTVADTEVPEIHYYYDADSDGSQTANGHLKISGTGNTASASSYITVDADDVGIGLRIDGNVGIDTAPLSGIDLKVGGGGQITGSYFIASSYIHSTLGYYYSASNACLISASGLASGGAYGWKYLSGTTAKTGGSHSFFIDDTLAMVIDSTRTFTEYSKSHSGAVATWSRYLDQPTDKLYFTGASGGYSFDTGITASTVIASQVRGTASLRGGSFYVTDYGLNDGTPNVAAIQFGATSTGGAKPWLIESGSVTYTGGAASVVIDDTLAMVIDSTRHIKLYSESDAGAQQNADIYLSQDDTLNIDDVVSLDVSNTSHGQRDGVVSWNTTHTDTLIVIGERTLTDYLPAGWLIEYIVFEEDSNLAITDFDIGFTDGGGEIVAQGGIQADDVGSFTINQRLSSYSSAQTIYLSASNWNGAGMTIYVMTRRFK